jgi:hypothetical protein
MSEHPEGNVVQLSAFRQKPDDANGLDQKGRGFEIAKAWAKDPRYIGAILLSVCRLPEKDLESPNRKRLLRCA